MSGYKFSPVSLKSIVQGVGTIPSRWINSCYFLYRMTKDKPIKVNGKSHTEGWAAVLVHAYSEGNNIFAGRVVLPTGDGSVEPLEHIGYVSSLFVPNFTSRYIESETFGCEYVRRDGQHYFGKGVPRGQLSSSRLKMRTTNNKIEMDLLDVNPGNILRSLLHDVGLTFPSYVNRKMELQQPAPHVRTKPLLSELLMTTVSRDPRQPNPWLGRVTREGDVFGGINLPAGVTITQELLEELNNPHVPRPARQEQHHAFVNLAIERANRRPPRAGSGPLAAAAWSSYISPLPSDGLTDIQPGVKFKMDSPVNKYRTLQPKRVSNDYCITTDVETNERFILYREVLVGTIEQDRFNFHPDFNFLAEDFQSCIRKAS